jgi:hypothetical protein
LSSDCCLIFFSTHISLRGHMYIHIYVYVYIYTQSSDRLNRQRPVQVHVLNSQLSSVHVWSNDQNTWHMICLPSGKLSHNYGKSPFFYGKIHYFYGHFQELFWHNQRVSQRCFCSPMARWCHQGPGFHKVRVCHHVLLKHHKSIKQKKRYAMGQT